MRKYSFVCFNRMNNNSEVKRNTANDESIDLLKLAGLFLKNWFVIALAAIVFAGLSLLGSKFLIPATYQSGFSAYINNMNDNSNSSSVTYSDLTASRSLTSTYAAVITSQPVVENALKQAGLNYTYKQMKKLITVKTVNDTEIIQINVVLKSPEEAFSLAKALQTVSPEGIAKIVAGSSMTIVSPAVVPDERYAPSYTKNTVLGFVIGAFLAAAYVFLKNLFDNRIKDRDELEEKFGIVVLGTIHDLNSNENKGYVYAGKRGE